MGGVFNKRLAQKYPHAELYSRRRRKARSRGQLGGTAIRSEAVGAGGGAWAARMQAISGARLQSPIPEPGKSVMSLGLSGLTHHRDRQGGVPEIFIEQKHSSKFLKRPGQPVASARKP